MHTGKIFLETAILQRDHSAHKWGWKNPDQIRPMNRIQFFAFDLCLQALHRVALNQRSPRFILLFYHSILHVQLLFFAKLSECPAFAYNAFCDEFLSTWSVFYWKICTQQLWFPIKCSFFWSFAGLFPFYRDVFFSIILCVCVSSSPDAFHWLFVSACIYQ